MRLRAQPILPPAVIRAGQYLLFLCSVAVWPWAPVFNESLLCARCCLKYFRRMSRLLLVRPGRRQTMSHFRDEETELRQFAQGHRVSGKARTPSWAVWFRAHALNLYCIASQSTQSGVFSLSLFFSLYLSPMLVSTSSLSLSRAS